jgi:hypothetical protein
MTPTLSNYIFGECNSSSLQPPVLVLCVLPTFTLKRSSSTGGSTGIDVDTTATSPQMAIAPGGCAAIEDAGSGNAVILAPSLSLAPITSLTTPDVGAPLQVGNPSLLLDTEGDALSGTSSSGSSSSGRSNFTTSNGSNSSAFTTGYGPVRYMSPLAVALVCDYGRYDLRLKRMLPSLIVPVIEVGTHTYCGFHQFSPHVSSFHSP